MHMSYVTCLTFQTFFFVFLYRERKSMKWKWTASFWYVLSFLYIVICNVIYNFFLTLVINICFVCVLQSISEEEQQRVLGEYKMAGFKKSSGLSSPSTKKKTSKAKVGEITFSSPFFFPTTILRTVCVYVCVCARSLAESLLLGSHTFMSLSVCQLGLSLPFFFWFHFCLFPSRHRVVQTSPSGPSQLCSSFRRRNGRSSSTNGLTSQRVNSPGNLPACGMTSQRKKR